MLNKFLTILLIACLLVACANAYCEIYSMLFVVNEIDYTNDIIALQSFNGHIFLYEGCEDWCIGDMVSALIWDNNTDIIIDDIILNIRYEGYSEGWIEILQRLNQEQLPY